MAAAKSTSRVSILSVITVRRLPPILSLTQADLDLFDGRQAATQVLRQASGDFVARDADRLANIPQRVFGDDVVAVLTEDQTD
jgi:hypothetical protein